MSTTRKGLIGIARQPYGSFATKSTVTISAADLAAIADAVWDELTASHVIAGSFGEQVGGKLLTLAKWIGLR